MTAGQKSLNPNHERRLTVTCLHIDKLLAEMQGALHVSESKLAFPQYVCDLTPGQGRVMDDYIGRIRAQLARVLDGQGIERPPAAIPISRSLHSHLAFVEIAAEELKPEYMRGYGAIPPAAAVELNGIASELQSLVRQFDRYLMHRAEQSLADRLARLERSGEEISLLKKLESLIAEHGMVEFRSTLSTILDRLEDDRFEIALFGRVSSGKSSLLNAMLGTSVLPVGVTPITAVPTRLLYGEVPAVQVWLANRQPEQVDISRLPEFVAEQLNPGNGKQVTRLVVRIPSNRLREGLAFVDTPGLGSLAGNGTRETLAYLPRCDLGVMLIDAASTLTPEDLETIRMLYSAGIPAAILLSKADLLKDEDRGRLIGYVKDYVQRELNLDLAVRAVSARAEGQDLLDRWFDEAIAPLHSQRRQLKLRSIQRKLGALRQSVEVALRSGLRRSEPVSGQRAEQLRVVEAELRQASGGLEEMKKVAKSVARDVERSSCRILQIAAATLTESWLRDRAEQGTEDVLVRDAIARTVRERTEALGHRLEGLAPSLRETLRRAAKVLGVEHTPAGTEFSRVVRELPAFDPGCGALELKRPFYLGWIGENLSRSLVANRLARRMGEPLAKALSAYGALLYDWSERTLAQMQRQFEAYADGYRAQVERLVAGHPSSGELEAGIASDREFRGNAQSEQTVSS